MKQLTIIIAILFLSSCNSFTSYIKSVSKRPNLLIGYQTVELRKDIDPIVELFFNPNSAYIGEAAQQEVADALRSNSYYVVEATAGGFSNNSQDIAKERISEMIILLESYGIPSSAIYVADYSASKAGRYGYIYQISY